MVSEHFFVFESGRNLGAKRVGALDLLTSSLISKSQGLILGPVLYHPTTFSLILTFRGKEGGVNEAIKQQEIQCTDMTPRRQDGENAFISRNDDTFLNIANMFSW